MPVNLLASPKLAFSALGCYAADLRAKKQHRAVFLKELSDYDYEKAPPGSKPVCYVIDNVGVLVAFYVPTPGSRVRPYIMITHLYVERGHRRRNHASVMLHMLREFALSNEVSTVRLGQGLRENAETIDFWRRTSASTSTP